MSRLKIAAAFVPALLPLPTAPLLHSPKPEPGIASADFARLRAPLGR